MLRDFDQDSCAESYTTEYGLRDMGEDSEEQDESDDETPKAAATRIKSTLDAVKDLVDEQAEIGYAKFLKKVEQANSKNRTFINEIEHRKSQRTMPMTWIPNSHAATMYYKLLNRTPVRKLYSKVLRVQQFTQ